MSEAAQVRKRHLSIYLGIIFAGIIIILICSSYQKANSQGIEEHNVWLETFIAIGQALIIGPTISFYFGFTIND